MILIFLMYLQFNYLIKFMNKVVICAAKRTLFGSFMGSLSEISAPSLGAIVVKELLSSID